MREALGRALEQRHGSLGVGALDVRDADRQLGETLPQESLVGGTTLPRSLQDLVGMERPTPVQKVLCPRQGLGGRQVEILGNALDPHAARR